MAAIVQVKAQRLTRFHSPTSFSGLSGQFSVGFGLGMVGISAGATALPLKFDALWMGLFVATFLGGLFGLWLYPGIETINLSRCGSVPDSPESLRVQGGLRTCPSIGSSI